MFGPSWQRWTLKVHFDDEFCINMLCLKINSVRSRCMCVCVGIYCKIYKFSSFMICKSAVYSTHNLYFFSKQALHPRDNIWKCIWKQAIWNNILLPHHTSTLYQFSYEFPQKQLEYLSPIVIYSFEFKMNELHVLLHSPTLRIQSAASIYAYPHI